MEVPNNKLLKGRKRRAGSAEAGVQRPGELSLSEYSLQASYVHGRQQG